jgi:benzoate-CoA ligase
MPASPPMTEPVTPPADFNFAGHLIERNAGRSGRLAYVDDREELTYGELASRVRRFAGGLAAIDMRCEERLLLLAP